MVVGWSMQRHMSTELVSDAMTMALWRRRPTALLQHSDQGSQYANELYQLLLADNGIPMQHEPFWERLGQLSHGELLLESEDRASAPESLPHA